MRFVLDTVDGCRGRNTVNGLELVRHCKVFDVPIKTSATGWQVLLDVLLDPQCPQLGAAFPDVRTNAKLEEHIPVAVEAGKRRFEMDLVYRAIPKTGGGSDQIVYTVEDSPVVSHVLTNSTSDQSQALEVWYKVGTGAGVTSAPAGSTFKGIQAHKAQVDRSIRFTGRASRTQWSAVKENIRGAAGCINNAPWGGYPRGEWMFMGPHTRTIDRGNTFDILLEFWWKRGGHYALGWYTDEFGNIPEDVSPETNVRSGGPPPEGQYRGRNGVVLGSVQIEKNFSALFSFTPDQEPGP